MGRGQERWEELMEAWKTDDFDAIEDLYATDAVFYEPYNPPHNGNLLVVAYLKDFLGGKDDIDWRVKRLCEDEEQGLVAVEWALSYTAAGRRWTDLPRASFLELDDDGVIRYHRDYT